MKKILFVNLSFLFFVGFSQKVQLSGVIKDSLNNALFGANIIIKQQGKIITYAMADDQGQFAKNVPTGENYIVKISYLGYETQEKFIPKLEKDIFFSITLKESKTKLKEVILSTTIPDVIQKKDTVIYNLKALTDRTEVSLKDMIEKLPGITINENGKVQVNGKQIDKILINGKQFFNKQHQLATENISAEMIQGIEFYTRFKTDFDSKADSPIRALNIKLKNKYLNKITGNALLGGGCKEKYKEHLNTFHFRQNMNIAFIGDLNNLGEQAISLTDYMELRGGVENFVKGELTAGHLEIDKDEIPSFLLSNKKVKDEKNYFGGLNIVYEKPKKMAFNGFYIYNLMQNTEETFSEKIFWKTTPVQNQKNLNGDYYIFNTASELRYRFSPDQTGSFLITTDWQHNVENGNYLNDNESLDFNQDSDFITLGSKLNYTQVFNKNNVWDTQFLWNYKNRDKTLYLTANYPFLEEIFSDETQLFSQNTLKDSYNYNVWTKWTYFYKRLQISMQSGLDYLSDQYLLNSNLDYFKNALNLNHYDYYTGIRVKYDGLGLHLNSKFDLHYTDLRIDESVSKTTNVYLSPFANLTYLFNLSHSISISYTYSNKRISSIKLFPQNYFSDINTIYKGNHFDKFYFPVHQINIYYSNYLKKHKFYYDINTNYTWQNQTLNTKMVQATNVISYYENLINPFSQTYNISLSFNKALKKHFYLNYEINYDFLEKELENSWSYKNKRFFSNLKIYSKLKNSPVNFSLGIKYTQYNAIYEENNSENNFDIYQPYIVLKGNLKKKLYWELKTLYDKYDFTGDTYYLNLSPAITYRLNNKFHFSIKGNNVLNLEEFKQIQWIATQNYTELKKVYNIPGYILLQLKFTY